MLKIIQEIIALTCTRRDWKGYPDYQEYIAPIEDQIDETLQKMGIPLEVLWDQITQMYGLFPTHLLYPSNNDEEARNND